MPGFNQQSLNYRSRSANKVTVLIGDQPLGFAQTVSHTFSFGTQQLYGIGNSLPQEIQQLRVSPHITVDMFALTQNGISILGYPANLATILAANEFNFSIRDGVTNTTLFTYVGGVCDNFSENIPTNQMITDALTFMCADVLGPNGTSIVSMSDAYTFPALFGNANGVAPAVNTNT
jgi:hypothetical protein